MDLAHQCANSSEPSVSQSRPLPVVMALTTAASSCGQGFGTETFGHEGIRPRGKAGHSSGRTWVGLPAAAHTPFPGGTAWPCGPDRPPPTHTHLGVSQEFLCDLITGPSSSRLFSLQVPLPPKIFLSLVYKLEGTAKVSVALELTSGDEGSCDVGISTLNGEGRAWPLPASWASPFSGPLGEEESRPGPRVCGAVSEVQLSARSPGPWPPWGGPPAGRGIDRGDIPWVSESPGGRGGGHSRASSAFLLASPPPESPSPEASACPGRPQGVLPGPWARAPCSAVGCPLSQVLRLLPQQTQAPGTVPDPSGSRPPSWPDGRPAVPSSSLGTGSSGESLAFLLSPLQGQPQCGGDLWSEGPSAEKPQNWRVGRGLGWPPEL